MALFGRIVIGTLKVVGTAVAGAVAGGFAGHGYVAVRSDHYENRMYYEGWDTLYQFAEIGACIGAVVGLRWAAGKWWDRTCRGPN